MCRSRSRSAVPLESKNRQLKPRAWPVGLQIWGRPRVLALPGHPGEFSGLVVIPETLAHTKRPGPRTSGQGLMLAGDIRLGWDKAGASVSQQEGRQFTAHLRSMQPPHTQKAGEPGKAGDMGPKWGAAMRSLEQLDTFVCNSVGLTESRVRLHISRVPSKALRRRQR